MRTRAGELEGESLDDLRARINAQLDWLLARPGAADTPVGQAIRESVAGPGKRVRAMLVTLAARDLGENSPAAMSAGCAIELVHTASLLLDDLPCMDNAEMRRGKPAIHISFGEDVAILASVALLGEAFGLISTIDGVSSGQSAAMSAALSSAIGLSGLVGGQYSDLRDSAAYSGAAATEANDRKTGALFVAALELAAILSHVSPARRETLRGAGLELGRAFQLYDDLLDIAGDPAKMGKDIGKDARKALLARAVAKEALLRQIGVHVGRARTAFSGLPSGGPGLLQFVDEIFGPMDPLPVRTPERLGVFGKLLA